MKREKFCILGLGIFGSTIATHLSQRGCDVIAVDMDASCVERLADVCEAVQADFTDLSQLQDLGIEDVDCAVVATGSHLEQSILGVLNLKELGVPYIIAKAKNRKYATVLTKLGVDKVIQPEKESGKRIAKLLASSNLADLVELDPNTLLAELVAPTSWIGKSIIELDLRNRYGVNIIGIKKGVEGRLSILLDATTVIEKGDNVVFIGTNEAVERLNNIE